MRNPFPPLSKLSQEIAIAYGDVKSSGYDLTQTSEYNSSDGYARSRWIKISGDTFMSPRDLLYFNTSGDYVCVAYDTRTKAILGHWNFSKKNGSSVSPSFLLHPYVWLYLIVAAISLWQLDWLKDPGAFLWLNLIFGAGFIISTLAAFYDWKREKIGQQKIAEFKQKNPEKGPK